MPGKKVYPKRSGKVAPAVKSYVKKQMRTNTELKRYEKSDQEKIEGTTTDANYITDLCTIAEGTGKEERIGSEIKLQGVQLKGMFHNNSSVVNYVRYVIGYFTQNVAGVLNSNTKLFRGPFDQQLSTTEVYGSGSQPYSLMTTPLHPELFHSLYDKVIKIGPLQSTDGNNTRLFNKFIKLHNKKVSFTTGDVPASINQPTPRLVVMRMYTDAGQDAGVTLQPIEYSGRSIVWYRDS